MKKTSNGMVAVVAGLAMLTLSVVSAAAAELPGFETYVVRGGDTLAKISGRVLGDAKRWREILKENPQVTNANRIYPGDTLLVPIPQSAATTGGAGGELAARAGAEGSAAVGVTAASTEAVAVPAGDQGAGGAVAGAGTADLAATAAAAAEPKLPAERVRAQPVINPALYRSAGHIAERLPGIAIVASQDGRILVSTDDAAIINAPIVPGTRFTVVRANRRVYHPLTRAYLGWLVRILGTAEVTCRDERTSTVVLRGMTDSASIGDYLVPIDPNDVLDPNALAPKGLPACLPAGPCDGVIVAFNEQKGAIGEREIAFIDRGRASGVAPGQRFTIYREIAPEGRVTVGELQVLRVGERTATALITNSVQEVQLGYLLRAR